MEEKTTSTREYEYAEAIAAYNAACQRVMGSQVVLAHILQGCIQDFANCSVRQVMDLVNSDDGYTKGKDTINVTTDEEGLAFDVLTTVKKPHSQDYMYVNVEGRYFPTLDFDGIEYALAKMLVMQENVELKDGHFENLKQCKSIYICIGAPEEIQNTISHYAFREGGLTEIVMIYLGEYERGQTGLLGLLNLLFTTRVSADEKFEILSDDFAIHTEDRWAKIRENFEALLEALL